MVIKHMEDGNSFWSFGGIIGVCFDTLHNWTKLYPDFSEAKKIGTSKLLLFDERIAKAGTTGQLKRQSKLIKKTKEKEDGTTETTEETEFEAAPFAQSYHIFMMKNRYPRLYRDKIHIDTNVKDSQKATNILKDIMKDPALAEAARIIAEKLSDE